MLGLPTPSLYSLLALNVGFGITVLSTITWYRRPSQPGAALSLYLLSVALWCFSYASELQAGSLAEKIFWSKVEYVGPAGVALFGLIFVLQYTGLDRWATAPKIALLSLIPVLTQIFAWTNERHGWVWSRQWLDLSGPIPLLARSHGPWFWVFLGYAYFLCLSAMLLLARQLVLQKGIYRSQAAVLLIGCSIPFVGNILYSFGFGFLPNLDMTVFSFSITGVSMVWGLFRFQMPTVTPLARQAVFEGMSDAVIALDIAGNVIEVNPEAARILQRRAALLVGRPAYAVLKTYPELAEICARTADSRAELTIETDNITRRFDVRCSVLRSRKQRAIGSVVVLRDITERIAHEAALLQATSILEQRVAERTADLSRTIEELRLLKDRLLFNATHDSLTGLLNRQAFFEHLAERVRSAVDATSAVFAILYLDIDRFKLYNDGYGHDVGDLILIGMAARLNQCFTAGATVARLGGDEFTVLLDRVSGETETAAIAAQCLRSVSAPFAMGAVSIRLTASMGITLSSASVAQPEVLVREADLAMYFAKRRGGNQSRFFAECLCEDPSLASWEKFHPLSRSVGA